MREIIKIDDKLKWLDNLEDLTDEEIALLHKKQNIENRKNTGIDYQHTDEKTYKVSLHSEDANGITTLKVASDTFGFFPTNFKLFNGQTVPIKTIDDMLSLGSFIASERAKFFIDESEEQ